MFAQTISSRAPQAAIRICKGARSRRWEPEACRSSSTVALMPPFS